MKILTENKIAELLQEDSVFLNSFNLKRKHDALKMFWITMGAILLILFITPLPEQFLLGRIGMVFLIIGSLLSWYLDSITYRCKIQRCAEMVYDVLSKNPDVKFEKNDDNTLRIIHPNIEAQCQKMTQIQLAEGLSLKEYVSEILREQNVEEDNQTGDKTKGIA